MNLKRTFVLAAVALMTATGVANAQPYTYTVVAGSGSGNWADANTWDGGPTYPVSGDTAVINNASYTITVAADAAAATLNLSAGTLVISSPRTLTVGTANISGGTLTINSGGFLTSSSSSSISGGAATVNGTMTFPSGTMTGGTLDINGLAILDGGTFEIDSPGIVDVKAGGTLQMQGAAPVIQIDLADGLRLSTATSKLLVKVDATIQGSGSLQGGNSSADVEIDATSDDVTLTLASGATMHGGMEIQKVGDNAANFINAGLVQADSSRTIRFGDLLDSITDSYGAGSRCDVHWRAESGPSILSFEIPATGLVTSFVVNGSFNCNSNTVTTTGSKSGSGSYACINAGSCP